MAPKLRDILTWLVRRPAYLMMTAQGSRLQGEDPRRFERAWIGVMALSLGWGLLACGIWVLCQLWIGARPGSMLLAPALVTGAVFCLWIYRRSMIATAQLLAPADDSARAMALAVLAAVVIGVLLCLPDRGAYREFTLPAMVEWVRPYDREYRQLLLAPLWGGWAMLIVPKFCRLCPTAERATAAFANGCGPLSASATMLLPLGGTLFYFQYFYWWWQIIIPAATVFAAVGMGWLLGRRQGLQRPHLLAVNLLTQLAFLLTYLVGLNCGVVPYY
jgi:hypothetical protein